MVVAARPAIALAARDRRILELAARAPHADFAAAVRELRAAVEAVIPGGRIYVLGAGEDGPIIGSLRSGVGLCARRSRAHVVHVGAGGALTWLGPFAP